MNRPGVEPFAMNDSDTDLIDPTILRRNLDALREIDPAAADLFAALPVPAGATACRGRDGSATFRLVREDGREHWLGGTSAPTVSAPALLSGFDAGSGNVLLFGIGHGTEVSLLLRRIEPHRGVLVLEPDAAAAALALRLHDYTDAIRRRRLVILPAAMNDAEARLTEFLLRHEGYCCPERVLVWPWQDPVTIPSVRGLVERAAAAAGQERARAIADLHARWRQHPPAELPARPRVAVVALMAAPPVWDWAERAVAGLREIGCAAEEFVVRSPIDCHVARLAGRLDAFQPDWALAIRASRNMLGSAVPPGVPIVSWLDPIGPDAKALAANLGPFDSIAVTSATLGRRLTEAGLPAERLAVVPLAAQPTDEPPPPDHERPYDVVMLCDVAPPDPEALGLRLHTQQVLWRETAAIIRREAESFTSDRAEAVLAAAEQRAKMAIREPEVRQAFCNAIAEALGPAVVAVEAVQQMLAAGLCVHVWGTGWESHPGAKSCRRGPLPSPEETRVILSQTKSYVCIDINGFVGSDLFDAITCGAVVIWRRHPQDATDGGLGTLFAEGTDYLAFRTAQELVASCRKIISGDEIRSDVAASAMSRLRREHAFAQRVRKLSSLAMRSLTGP